MDRGRVVTAQQILADMTEDNRIALYRIAVEKAGTAAGRPSRDDGGMSPLTPKSADQSSPRCLRCGDRHPVFIVRDGWVPECLGPDQVAGAHWGFRESLESEDESVPVNCRCSIPIPGDVERVRAAEDRARARTKDALASTSAAPSSPRSVLLPREAPSRRRTGRRDQSLALAVATVVYLPLVVTGFVSWLRRRPLGRKGQ